jgi:hypothetical protein
VQALTTKFCDRHPLVRFEVVSDRPERVLQDVADRKINATFLAAHPTEHGPKGDAVLAVLRIRKLDEFLWLALPHYQERGALTL